MYTPTLNMTNKRGVRCSVVSCKQYSFTSEFPYHRFPKDIER